MIAYVVYFAMDPVVENGIAILWDITSVKQGFININKF